MSKTSGRTSQRIKSVPPKFVACSVLSFFFSIQGLLSFFFFSSLLFLCWSMLIAMNFYYHPKYRPMIFIDADGGTTDATDGCHVWEGRFFTFACIITTTHRSLSFDFLLCEIYTAHSNFNTRNLCLSSSSDCFCSLNFFWTQFANRRRHHHHHQHHHQASIFVVRLSGDTALLPLPTDTRRVHIINTAMSKRCCHYFMVHWKANEENGFFKEHNSA